MSYSTHPCTTSVPTHSLGLVSTSIEERDCRVYAFHMNPTAWSRRVMRNNNLGFSRHQQLLTEPLYVGETRKTIEERFHIHQDPSEFTSTLWGKHHFKRDFHLAFDRAIGKLRKEYGREHQVSLDALTRTEARIHEKGFALWLRRRGYAVHFG